MDYKFTHIVYDTEGELVRKYRWTKEEAKWYSDTHPYMKVVFINKKSNTKDKSEYQKALETVGECLL